MARVLADGNCFCEGVFARLFLRAVVRRDLVGAAHFAPRVASLTVRINTKLQRIFCEASPKYTLLHRLATLDLEDHHLAPFVALSASQRVNFATRGARNEKSNCVTDFFFVPASVVAARKGRWSLAKMLAAEEARSAFQELRDAALFKLGEAGAALRQALTKCEDEGVDETIWGPLVRSALAQLDSVFLLVPGCQKTAALARKISVV